MARSEKAVVTVLCMVHDGTRLLLQNRVKADWRGYTLPGGHVEKGESFTDAVIREVKEETALTILSPQLCGIKDWYDDGLRYVVLLYRAEHFFGTLLSSDEGEVWWEEIENVPDLRLASEDMMDMLRVFREDSLSEFFYYKDGSSWSYELK